MKLPRHTIAAALAERTLHGSFKQLSNEIAAYLLAERRTGELDSLIRDIMQYRTDRGIVEVIARTAHPLTVATRADIEREIKQHYPKATTIIVTEVPDGSVVGGTRLELANQQLDISVRNKLNRLKQLTAAGKDY